MSENVLLSLLLLFTSHFVVKFIWLIHMIILNHYNNVHSDGHAQVSLLKSPAYHTTIQYHPIYSLLVFPCFALIYLIQVNPVNLLHEAFVTGNTWTIISILLHYITLIVIPHKWQSTYKDFYINYQPLVTLIYTTIFISPLIAGVIFHYIL